MSAFIGQRFGLNQRMSASTTILAWLETWTQISDNPEKSRIYVSRLKTTLSLIVDHKSTKCTKKSKQTTLRWQLTRHLFSLKEMKLKMSTEGSEKSVMRTAAALRRENWTLILPICQASPTPSAMRVTIVACLTRVCILLKIWFQLIINCQKLGCLNCPIRIKLKIWISFNTRICRWNIPNCTQNQAFYNT